MAVIRAGSRKLPDECGAESKADQNEHEDHPNKHREDHSARSFLVFR